jgi:hypothetical protein
VKRRLRVLGLFILRVREQSERPCSIFPENIIGVVSVALFFYECYDHSSSFQRSFANFLIIRFDCDRHDRLVIFTCIHTSLVSKFPLPLIFNRCSP